MTDFHKMSKESTSQLAVEMKKLKKDVDIFDLPNSDGTPSPCALQCMAQQQALVDCVNEIKDSPDDGKVKQCLEPSAEAWITCCSEANTFAGVDPTRPS